MVDVSKIRTDWEDVSEADWQVNSARAQANKITAEPLNALGLGVIEALSQSGTSGALGVPVFGSQAEALAYEAANPGKVALWFDAAAGLTSVTATAPTFTDVSGTASDTYTIPTKAGVVYKVAGAIKAAGTYPGSGTVTVTAEAAEGYILTGTASWSHTFSTATGDTPVTPTGPTWTDDSVNGGGSWTTPTQTGVTYSPASGTATPGQTVTVTATATSGYYIDGTSSWQHTFPAAAGLGPVAIANGYADSFDDEPGDNPTGWAAEWDQSQVTSWTETVGGYLRVVRGGGGVFAAFRMVPFGTAQDVDVVARFHTLSGLLGGRNIQGVLVGGSGAQGAEDGIAVRLSTINGQAVSWSVYTAGSIALSSSTLVPWTQGASVNMRVNVSGTTVNVKVWDEGTAEPGTWSATFTAPAAKTGWVGLSAIAVDSPLDYDYFAAVTTGTAPLD